MEFVDEYDGLPDQYKNLECLRRAPSISCCGGGLPPKGMHPHPDQGME